MRDSQGPKLNRQIGDEAFGIVIPALANGLNLYGAIVYVYLPLTTVIETILAQVELLEATDRAKHTNNTFHDFT